jgi:hypothetical protein
MPDDTVIEVRLEVYTDADWAPALADQISALLARRWPESWDVKLPPRPNRDHPAEWRAVVPLPAGATPESSHGAIEADVRALDPSHQLHFRTRWSFQESPNHQEVYEVGWDSDSA